MRLKDKDDGIAVELLVPEVKALQAAAKILRKISKVPCAEQTIAADAVGAIEEVLLTLNPKTAE